MEIHGRAREPEEKNRRQSKLRASGGEGKEGEPDTAMEMVQEKKSIKSSRPLPPRKNRKVERIRRGYTRGWMLIQQLGVISLEYKRLGVLSASLPRPVTVYDFYELPQRRRSHVRACGCSRRVLPPAGRVSTRRLSFWLLLLFGREALLLIAEFGTSPGEEADTRRTFDGGTVRSIALLMSGG